MHTVEYELLVQPLMETGLDSLGVVEIQDMIASHFAVNIPATFSFDYPTLASMAIQIASLLRSTPAVDKIDPQESLTYNGNQRYNNGNQSGVIGVGCRYPKGTHYCDNIFCIHKNVYGNAPIYRRILVQLCAKEDATNTYVLPLPFP